MDRLRDMEVFLAVVDAGSFAGAARQLRMSAPAVTRSIAALEARLGTVLLHRTTRSLSLSEHGRRYALDIRELLGSLERAEDAITGSQTDPTGTLSITAPSSFGRLVVAPVAAKFIRKHKAMNVSLNLLDRVTNLVEEGFDLAVRIGDLPDSTLMSRKVGEVRRMLVASPDFLARNGGGPGDPQALPKFDTIGFTGLAAARTWRWQHAGKVGNAELATRLEVNDAQTAINLAAAGHGITAVLSYMVADQLANGFLTEVLPEFSPAPVPVQLVHAERRLVAPKLRAFMDFAGPKLKAALDARAI